MTCRHSGNRSEWHEAGQRLPHGCSAARWAPRTRAEIYRTRLGSRAPPSCKTRYRPLPLYSARQSWALGQFVQVRTFDGLRIPSAVQTHRQHSTTTHTQCETTIKTSHPRKPAAPDGSIRRQPTNRIIKKSVSMRVDWSARPGSNQFFFSTELSLLKCLAITLAARANPG
jgi:hypothetical protein